jgi:hypothetical protein
MAFLLATIVGSGIMADIVAQALGALADRRRPRHLAVPTSASKRSATPI